MWFALLSLLTPVYAESPLDRYSTPAITSSAAVPADPFQWSVDAVRVAPGAHGMLVLKLTVPAGTHVFRDQLEVKITNMHGVRVGTPDLPPGFKFVDPDVGPRERYDLDVLINVPVDVPAAVHGLIAVDFEVRHQGCKDGLCWAPKISALTAYVNAEGAK